VVGSLPGVRAAHSIALGKSALTFALRVWSVNSNTFSPQISDRPFRGSPDASRLNVTVVRCQKDSEAVVEEDRAAEL